MAGWQREVLPFVGLVMIRVAVGVAFKTAGDGGSYALSPAFSLVLSEAVKCAMALPLAGSRARLAEHARDRVVLGSAVGLALLYCVNNLLAFELFLLADPATLSVTKSLSTLVVAVITYVVLARHYTPTQWLCAAVQGVGLSVIFLNERDATSGRLFMLAPTTLGLLAVAVTLTGSASVWNAAVVQRENVSLNAFNVLLYGWGVVFNALALFATEHVTPATFTSGWSLPNVAVLACNALIGLAISAVYKYAGAVTKTWATAAATCLLFALDGLFGWADLPMLPIVQGLFLVFSSAYMFQQQRVQQEQQVLQQQQAAAVAATTNTALPGPGAETGGGDAVVADAAAPTAFERVLRVVLVLMCVASALGGLNAAPGVKMIFTCEPTLRARRT